MRHQAKPQRGFTLHETIVVSVIIGLIASQGLPGIINVWDRMNLARIANTLLMVASAVRQHAIADERGSLLELRYDTWCGRFIDEHESNCSLAYGRLPSRFRFNHGSSEQAIRFEYTPGRGFSPLSAGSARIFANKSSRDILLVNSSLGRLRVCSYLGYPNIEPC